MKITRYLSLAFLGALALVLAFSATAFATTATAAAVAGPDSSWTDLLRPVWDAFHSGHYVAAGSLAVVVVVSLLKKYAPGKLGAWISGKIGSTIAVLVASFAGSLAAATADGTWTWSMLTTSAAVAAMAAGGYTVIKDLVVDPLVKSTWYTTKAPSWLKAGMSLILWWFEKPDAITTATQAGDKAVEAKPAQGASAPGIAGKPTDL